MKDKDEDVVSRIRAGEATLERPVHAEAADGDVRTTANYTQHHIWCNYAHLPLESCKSCARLYALYPWHPLGDELGAALIAKHFPDVIVRPGTEGR